MLLFVLLLLPESQLQTSRSTATIAPPRVNSVRDTALGMAITVAVMAALGSVLSPANVNRFGLAMCTGLVVLSLVPLTGWAGQVSLAPLAFAGVGAIAYSQLGGADGHLWAVPLAGLVAVPVGAVLAIPALRLQGLYLALSTFAFATVASSVLFAQPFAFAGQTMATPRLSWFGISTSSGQSYLVLVTVAFAFFAILLAVAFHSRWGRRLVALRDSEVASATVGVNLAETKLIVFCFSAFLAGVAGAFTGMFYERTDASAFQPLLGLTMVLALVIGGVSYLSGALYAGLFLVGLALLKEVWDTPLVRSIEYLGPGLAALGIIANPDGAVVPIGRAFARLLPWRHDAKEADAVRRAATSEPELGELGLSTPFTEADRVYLDRMLGVADSIPEGAGR
jgi:branched-chain amino acid transport system permease protein